MKSSDFTIILENYTGDDAHVEIPRGVTEIGSYAFFDNDTLKSVVIPESVYEIQQQAFADCTSLEEVTLSSSLEVWDWSLFENCKALRLFHVPADSWVRQIPDVLGIPAVDFCGKPLPPVAIKEEDWIFEEHEGEITLLGRTSRVAGTLYPNPHGATTLYIPDMLKGLPVTAIGEYAFQNDTGIDALYLPEGLKRIEKGAFCDCRIIEKIHVCDSLVSIAPDAFSGCEPDEETEELLRCIDGYDVEQDTDEDSDGFESTDFERFCGEMECLLECEDISISDMYDLYEAVQDGSLVRAARTLLQCAPPDVSSPLRWACNKAQEIFEALSGEIPF